MITKFVESYHQNDRGRGGGRSKYLLKHFRKITLNFTGFKK